jgi:hypothetical protein
MFNYLDDFYSPSDLGLVLYNFLNSNFVPTFQSNKVYYGGDRLKAYPCLETNPFSSKDKTPYNVYHLFKNTFENKTPLKILHMSTFLRKIKLDELKKSPAWKQYKQHTDDEMFDLAGIVYFNCNSLKDGTYMYSGNNTFEPDAIIGSKMNRCVFYNTQQFHSPGSEQEIEERWVQPFFIIHKEETFKKFKNQNES